MHYWPLLYDTGSSSENQRAGTFRAAFWSDTGGIRKYKTAAAELFAHISEPRRLKTPALPATDTHASLRASMAQGAQVLAIPCR